MTLAKYLIENNVVTGPLEKNTSHSGLEVIRKFILGQPQFIGGETFLKFGSALHEVFLENIFTTYNTLSKPEKAKIVAMVNKLNSHPVVARLMQGSIREEKIYGTLYYALLALILDGKQPPKKRGFDLKTTTCRTQEQFESKMVSYGYVKQGLIYKKLAGLKEFYFVAIQKETPYEIFIIDTNKYKKEEQYADQELKFLTYFYKHYGKVTTPTPTTNMKQLKNSDERLYEEILVDLKARTEAKQKAIEHRRIVIKCDANIRQLSRKFVDKKSKLYKVNVVKILNSLKK